MTAALLKLRAQRPASRPAAAYPSRRRRLSPPAWLEQADVALIGAAYLVAFALLADVALRAWP